MDAIFAGDAAALPTLLWVLFDLFSFRFLGFAPTDLTLDSKHSPSHPTRMSLLGKPAQNSEPRSRAVHP
jgi:hypothetical protein